MAIAEVVFATSVLIGRLATGTAILCDRFFEPDGFFGGEHAAVTVAGSTGRVDAGVLLALIVLDGTTFCRATDGFFM